MALLFWFPMVLTSCLVTWVWVTSAVLRVASVAVGGVGATIPGAINSSSLFQGKYSVVVFVTVVSIGCCLFGWIVLIDILSGNSAELFQEFS